MAVPAVTTEPQSHVSERPATLYVVLGLFLVGAIVVTMHRVGMQAENNFLIFRAAFRHLAAGQDLYAAYPAEHTDYFKYSPTFALLFAPFALLPVVPAYFVWQVVSIAVLVFGARQLLTSKELTVALVIAWPSVVTDMQRAQTNTLCAGLMLLAWSCLDQRRQLGAAASAALGTFVKLFPMAALAGALMYPKKVRQGLIMIAVMTIGALLPLLVTSPESLMAQYRSWYAIETLDTVPVQYGVNGAGLYAGIMGLLHAWFHVDWPHWPIQLTGLVILLAPLLHKSRWTDAMFRVQLIASILIFSVLFNHQAESPSYVIAMVGIGVWFASADQTRWRTALILFAMLLVNVGSSGILPRDIYRNYYLAYLLKTVPLIPIWAIMQLELHGLVRNVRPSEIAEVDEAQVDAAQTVPNAV